MKHLFFAGAAALAAMSVAARAAPLADPAQEAEARRIHEQVVTLDTHVDIPLEFASVKIDPGGFTASQVDLPKMRAGGLDAAFFIVYTPQGDLTPEGFARARHIAFTRLAAIHRFAGAYPDSVMLARTANDVRTATRWDRKVAFIGMENAYPLGAEISQRIIDDLAAQGVRYVGITHFGHNQFGDSSNPNLQGGDEEERHGGLSDLGRDLISMLNKAGIMVDVSHTGKKTMMQAADLSEAPVIASHSGVKALADTPRNLDDEQLVKIKETGGVAQIVALDVYLKPLNEEQETYVADVRKRMGMETREQRAGASLEKLAEYEEAMKKRWEIAPRASVADLVNHIDHAVKIAGIDHVGIASDFDGGGGIVGWPDASETLNVTRELVRRGYTQEEIAKIWGGNLLRVLKETEKTAKRLSR